MCVGITLYASNMFDWMILKFIPKQYEYHFTIIKSYKVVNVVPQAKTNKNNVLHYSSYAIFFSKTKCSFSFYVPFNLTNK